MSREFQQINSEERGRGGFMLLRLPVFFFFSFFWKPYPEHRGISEQNIILQTIEQLIRFSYLF